MQLPKPHAVTNTINYVHKRPDLCMIECVWIKGFSLSSLSLSVSVSLLCRGVKLVVRSSTLTPDSCQARVGDSDVKQSQW